MNARTLRLKELWMVLIPLAVLVWACPPNPKTTTTSKSPKAKMLSTVDPGALWCTYTITWKPDITPEQRQQDKDALASSLVSGVPGYTPVVGSWTDVDANSSQVPLNFARAGDTTINKPPPGTRPPAGRVTYGIVTQTCTLLK